MPRGHLGVAALVEGRVTKPMEKVCTGRVDAACIRPTMISSRSRPRGGAQGDVGHHLLADGLAERLAETLGILARGQFALVVQSGSQ